MVRPSIKLFPTFPMKCHSQRKTNYVSVMKQKLRVEKHFKMEEIKNCREEVAL